MPPLHEKASFSKNRELVPFFPKLKQHGFLDEKDADFLNALP
jgi:hypothetical protein